MASQRFSLLDRIVDPSLNRVTGPSGQPIQVEPKIMQVLCALADRAGEVVTRDELMQRVWPGVFVTDDALHRAIRELRRIFDDEPDAPRVVETIRKVGYRLLPPVHRLDDRISTATRPVRDTSQLTGTRPGRAHDFRMATGIAAVILLIAIVWWATGRRGVETEASVRFVPLTSDPGNEVDPALSASGRLAYVARAADGRAHIFTRTAADVAAAQVTRGESTEHAPAWSPDEARLAFVRMDDRGCTIAVAAADGREARTLAPCTATDEFRMSWSPDGRLLAVTSGATTARSPSHIEVIALADGSRRRITEPPSAHSGDSSPSFSPDGRELAFVRSISGSISDIFIVAVEGGAPRRVTTDNADVLGVDWEPDGRHLVFSSDRAGGISVWRVDARGGEPALLAGGGAKLKHPTVARRTGTIAYEDWQYEINLHERSTAPGETAPVPISPTSDRWNFHPAISPDGTRLAFQSTRSGQYELWLAARDGSNARPLTRSSIYKSAPRWSPDGRRLVFTTRRGACSDIVILNVDDGSTRTLLVDAASAVAPSWSADGRSIYFGSLRSGAWEIWNADASSGAARQVTTDGGYAALESADGRWLYVARLDRRGLWRRPRDGGAETLVTDRVIAEQWPNWGLYDRGIYYVTWPDEGDPCLAVVADGSTAPRLLTRLPAYAWTGIAVSRDGSQVIYAHADRRAANIGALVVQR